MLDLWYKNAIIYCLDVDGFMDSNGDGVGDFQGLADRLDHLESLGVTCVWLLPFYPSPNRDNGYDITDFYGVDPRLGSLGDFVNFTRQAHDRGMRVIVDLVVNHTSIDHPWFQAARSDPKSRYRDWYVWSKDKPANAAEGVIFPGVQETTWTLDDAAGEYYFHRFYDHQADLNIANPAVREEIEKIMGFWLQLGVSGFRIDAVPFLIEHQGDIQDGRDDEHRYLTELHNFLSWRKAEAVMLAEANIPMDKTDEYFGDGDRMHMVFHFMLNQNLFLGLARGDATPVAEILAKTPPIPPTGQWASFLRNHDELDLGRLSDAERTEAFAAFGPDADMQIYDRGIRRRLAPMLGGDQRRLMMAFSLMFALPGTPVLWYGDEIGMGDDLTLEERNSVRTPMQWSAAPNAGFSHAPEGDLVRPVIDGGDFGFACVNVAEQLGRHGSLMEHVRRLTRTRRACREVGWGACERVETGEKSVLGLACRWRGGSVVTLHNFADRPVDIPLDLGAAERVTPLLGEGETCPPYDPAKPVALAGYGFRWFRIEGEL